MFCVGSLFNSCTPESLIREQKRELIKAKRSIERSLFQYEKELSTNEAVLKGHVRNNRYESAQATAKGIIRSKKMIQKMQEGKQVLTSIEHALNNSAMMETLMESMRKAVGVQRQLNGMIDVSHFGKLVAAFERENGKLEMKQDMMDDINGDKEEVDKEANTEIEEMLSLYAADLNVVLENPKIKKQNDQAEIVAKKLNDLQVIQ